MSDVIEHVVLQRVVSELEDEGYEVYVRPNRSRVPEFLGTFTPDAIAMGNGKSKNLVVEVLRQSPESSERLRQITGLVQRVPGWSLRVEWVSPSSVPAPLTTQTRIAMRDRLSEVEQLRDAGHLEPAHLLAWATFEALARALRGEAFVRPQSPGRLVETLAGDGYLTPTEADHLRGLAKKRNRFIHGELDTEIQGDDLTKFMAVLDTLMAQLPDARAAPDP
jgi:uncharacterized protein YutE (UPF0331/DUF86 family)